MPASLQVSPPGPKATPSDIKLVASFEGRFILSDRTVAAGADAVQHCRTQSITDTELTVASPLAVTVGERFASSFKQLGPIDGTVARVVSGGFVVTIAASANERRSLAATLLWLKRHHVRKAEDHRAAARTRMRGEACKVTHDGTGLTARLFDMSATGASLAAPALPPIGAVVTIGRIEGVVVRHVEGRFSVKFVKAQALATLLEGLTG